MQLTEKNNYFDFGLCWLR